MNRPIQRLAARLLAPSALFASLALFALLVSAGVVHAQSDVAVDPPTRVARLADFSGQVWLYSPDTGEWISAARNQPVSSGDRLATERDARVELQLGSATLRLDANTELEVTTLDDQSLELRLDSGSAYVRVPDLANTGAIELTTDDGRFIVQNSGNYRFDRDGSTSRVTVYGGLARYEGPNSALTVTAGQRAEFWIDSGGVAQYTLSTPVSDAFTAWNTDRDRREAPAGATALRYVSPEMTGAEDLDRYGRWEQSPDYGALWIPTVVAADWAPYRTGHWAWLRPWGWTWVDDAPWGFAPFHYGRWVNVRNTWCWAPGNRVVRPVYAPALVAWMGTPHAGVSITVGRGPAVGWFPLAPREVYVPSYRVSPRYAREINTANVSSVTVINNAFANPHARREFDNRRWPGAVTVVPAGVMAARQPVAPAAERMRHNPQARELFQAQQPGRGPAALIAPPVATPMPARAIDPRSPVRPPPGFAERPALPRPGAAPGVQDRDRDGRGRDAGRPEGRRPMPPAAGQPPVMNAPAAPSPQIQQPQPRIVSRPPPPPEAGERRAPHGDRGERGGRGERADVAPPAPVFLPAPAPAAAPQQGPRMRAQPVRREEIRAPAPAPAQPPAEVQRPQAPRAPAAPNVPHPQRPVEGFRPAPPAHPAPQGVAPAAPRPAAQPEMRRPELQRREAPAEPRQRGNADRDPQR